MKNNKIAPEWVLMAVYAASLILLLCVTGCNGCNKPAPQPVPVPVVIEAKHQPAEDSLAMVIQRMKHRDDSITADNAKLRERLRKITQRADTAITKGNQAIKENDCTELADAFISLQNEHNEFRAGVAQQEKSYEQRLKAKDTSLDASYANVELQKKKFKELSNYTDGVEKIAAFNGDQLKTSERKLRRNRKANSISVPVAVVATTAAVAPQYIVPAVGVGAVLHFILKPKKLKK